MTDASKSDSRVTETGTDRLLAANGQKKSPSRHRAKGIAAAVWLPRKGEESDSLIRLAFGRPPQL